MSILYVPGYSVSVLSPTDILDPAMSVVENAISVLSTSAPVVAT